MKTRIKAEMILKSMRIKHQVLFVQDLLCNENVSMKSIESFADSEYERPDFIQLNKEIVDDEFSENVSKVILESINS